MTDNFVQVRFRVGNVKMTKDFGPNYIFVKAWNCMDNNAVSELLLLLQ